MTPIVPACDDVGAGRTRQYCIRLPGRSSLHGNNVFFLSWNLTSQIYLALSGINQPWPLGVSPDVVYCLPKLRTIVSAVYGCSSAGDLTPL